MNEVEEKDVEETEIAEITEEEKRGCRNGCLITIGVIVLLFLFGVLTITTEGCGVMPIDVVIFNNCIFATLGLKMLVPIGIALILGVPTVIYFVIKAIIEHKSKNRKE